jgi:hypothetical protein
MLCYETRYYIKLTFIRLYTKAYESSLFFNVFPIEYHHIEQINDEIVVHKHVLIE